MTATEFVRHPSFPQAYGSARALVARLDLHQLLYPVATLIRSRMRSGDNSGSRMTWRARRLRENRLRACQGWRYDTMAPAEWRPTPSLFLFEPPPNYTVRRSWPGFWKSRNGEAEPETHAVKRRKQVTKSACRLGAAIAISIPLLAQEAHAQFARPAMMNIGRAYVGAAAGIIIPNDFHSTFTGALAGSGDLTFSVGPAFTGLIGYHLNDILAVEGEFGYASFDYDRFNGNLNGIAVSAPANGNVNTTVLLANVIATPFGRAPGFSPYIGGGLGFASFDSTITAIGGTGFRSTSNETDFAANLIAGFDFPVGGRWRVGGRYRFIWVNTSGTTMSGAVTASRDDFTAHVITANAIFRF